MIRVGVSPEAFPSLDERQRVFASIGRAIYSCIRDAVPHEDGQKILDFGCGSGRVLRWFAAEPGVDLAGCDIHPSSITWMQTAFDPGIRLYVNSETPPLPEPDNTYDLVYCGSVFSHLTNWAPWLLELRRILRPGGALVASFHGMGFWDQGFHGSRGVPWSEDETGILIEHYGSTFDEGWGPAVYMSDWWVREHWGRALDIERLEPAGFGITGNHTGGQGWMVGRKPADTVAATASELELPSSDPRETMAALRGRQLAYEEIGHLTAYLRSVTAQLRRAEDPRGDGD
jgi:SAM-dependent methyltransferase